MPTLLISSRGLRALAAAGLLPLAALAQDLPGTSACRAALQTLAQAEDALLAAAPPASAAAGPDDSRQRAVTARLLPLRQQVADACLGGMTTSPPPSQRTWSGAAPTLPAVLAPAGARAPAVGAPVVTVAPPRFEAPVTLHCTGMACLASDGAVLTRVGPVVTGPKGPCTAQGGLVRCP
ncbi:MAG: hypothetical protein EKK53_03235 [Burkholderiales bacterium]|nr:MAG: hypothetical protein EKK53_03235 [Burkholderiales bacterium]